MAACVGLCRQTETASVPRRFTGAARSAPARRGDEIEVRAERPSVQRSVHAVPEDLKVTRAAFPRPLAATSRPSVKGGSLGIEAFSASSAARSLSLSERFQVLRASLTTDSRLSHSPAPQAVPIIANRLAILSGLPTPSRSGDSQRYRSHGDAFLPPRGRVFSRRGGGVAASKCCSGLGRCPNREIPSALRPFETVVCEAKP